MALLVLGYLGFILIGLPDGLVGVAWPSVRATFALPDAGLGLVVAAMASGHFLSGLVSGRLIQRYGTGGLLAISASLSVAGIACQVVAPAWPFMVAGGAVAGLGAGGIDGGLNTYVAGRWPTRQINWLHGCYGVGATAGPFLMSSMLATNHSWRAGYLVCAVLTGFVAAAFLATRARWAGMAKTSAGRSGGSAFRNALRHRLVPLHLGIFFLYTGLEVMVGQWSFTVLTESRFWAAPQAATWTGLYWASLTAGRFGLGALVGLVGPIRMVRLCLAATVAGTMLFALGVPQPGLILTGVGLAPVFPTMISRMPERLGAGTALYAVGFMVSAAMVGSGALPSIAGLVADWFGLAAIGWVATATAALMFGLHEALLARIGQRPGRAASPDD